MAGLVPGYASVVDKVSKNLKSLLPNVSSAGLNQHMNAGLAPTIPLTRSQNVGANSFTSKLTGMPNLNSLGGIPLTRSSQLGSMGSTGSRTNLGNLFGAGGNFSSMINPNNMFGSTYMPPAPGDKQAADTSGSALPRGGDPALARGMEGTAQYQDILQRASEESGVPWQVLAAIMGIESGGQNLSSNGAGAQGLMQVVPQYWQDTANKFGGDLMDPYTNIRTASEILKQNYNTYGSWEKAAAAYFGGGGAFNADGSYSDHKDSFGTDIMSYVNAFKGNLASIGYGAQTSSESQAGGMGATSMAQGAIDSAITMIGTPYVLGGAAPGAFDCSGLVQWAYGQNGKQLPRTAQQQYNATKRITYDELQPGDLIFFSGTTDQPGVTHVGIYLGNGQMLQAPKEGDVVKISGLDSEFWNSHTYGYGRVY